MPDVLYISGKGMFVVGAFLTGLVLGAWLREMACSTALGRLDGRHARTRGRLRQCKLDLQARRTAEPTEDE